MIEKASSRKIFPSLGWKKKTSRGLHRPLSSSLLNARRRSSELVFLVVVFRGKTEIERAGLFGLDEQVSVFIGVVRSTFAA